MFPGKKVEEKYQSNRYKNWKELYNLFGVYDEYENNDKIKYYPTSLSRDAIYKNIMKKRKFRGTNIKADTKIQFNNNNKRLLSTEQSSTDKSKEEEYIFTNVSYKWYFCISYILFNMFNNIYKRF